MCQRAAIHCWCLAIVGWLTLVAASPAFSQPLVDPRFVEFSPSTDHNATDADGTPLLDFYRFDLYVAGQTQPINSLDLGKPDPQSDGKIRVEFVVLLPSPLVAGIVYEARVVSVGPGGTSVSTVSNTFTAASACAPAISPGSQTAPASAGTGTVTVTADAGCSWTAVSHATWLTVTSGASGSGNGTAQFSIAANTSASSRTGTLTVADATFTVTQAGISCTYTVSPLSQNIVEAGGSGTIAVTAPAGCGWTASSNASWINVTSGASGTGNGTVGFTAGSNPALSPRTGTLLVAGSTFTVTQAASTCSYSVSPTSQVFGAGADAGSMSVTAPAGCAWTATTSAAWVSIDSGTGNGSGTVTYSIPANTTAASRTTTIAVGGATFTLTQAGLTCTYTVTPLSQTFGAAGGTGAIVITGNAGCTWKATSNVSWITITSNTSGTGSGSTMFSVASNATTAVRTGTATIAGRTFTVTQSGLGCTYTTSPDSVAIPKTGGTGSIAITVGSGCAWTASTSATWLTISGSGSGSGTATYTATINPSTFTRTATIVIASRVLIVTQSGLGTLPAPPRNLRLLGRGGS